MENQNYNEMSFTYIRMAIIKTSTRGEDIKKTEPSYPVGGK